MINKSLLGCSVALLGTLPFASLQAKQAQSQKKNVLFLIVDDLRPELNCYGAKHMITPAIDKLASEGVMFENAYCNVPVSGASRASLFSGLRPGKSRYWDVTAEIDIEAPGTITLPQHFRENGYVTISNSKVIHGKDDAAARSWDEKWMPDSHSATWRDYLGEENLNVEKQKGGPAPYETEDVPDNAYIDGKTVDKTIADLQKLKKSGKPFFLASGILKPHLPFNAPKKYWDLYERNEIRLPETFEFDRTGFPKAAFHNYNEIRYYNGIPAKADIPASEGVNLIHGYRACVSYADAQVGKILAELKRLGLDKNTIVVLVGDHGWSLGDHNQWCKHSNFNVVNNAPLIMRTPGNKKKGTEAKVVEFVDIYPTLCEEAGISVPEHTEGSSFSKLLHGKDADWKDCAIVKWHKGVTYFDRTHGYTEWRNQNNELEDQMLFIYSNDPTETRNVAENPKNADVIKRLQKKIEEHRGKTFFVKTPRPEPYKEAKN
ncbi:MAG: sulfatase [Bacteroidales bacterium]